MGRLLGCMMLPQQQLPFQSLGIPESPFSICIGLPIFPFLYNNWWSHVSQYILRNF
ncbi:unnamed protein product [Meloidogyne enterolobii]|uniref:Uncharacterized protein n=1 Tax=Meloidogyne enterolobii TaxID=390850 RepID=A0ACB0YM11_MELEN